MTKRKSEEELSYTRTVARMERMQRLIEDISLDWYASKIGSISEDADTILAGALGDFRRRCAEHWEAHLERERRQ